MNNSIYRVFPNVLPVVGYHQGILCDLFRGDTFILPKDLIELISRHGEFHEDQLIELYGADNTETILEYIDFLVNRKLVFSTNRNISRCIPTFSLEWDCPSTITNAQIAISSTTKLEALKVALSELQQLGCKALGLIIEGMPLSSIIDFISFIDSTFNFILEISVDYEHNTSQDILINQVEDLKKVVRTVICGGNQSSYIKSDKYNYLCFQWVSTHQKQMPCSYPSPSSFNSSMPFFCESKSFNSCLNRKLSIDSKGNVRNCIASKLSFGKIMEHSISKIINSSSLPDIWNITKDQIDVCKDCEFRHMCTDCRVFIKDPENIYSQPAKCTYNPYIAKWQGEEGYVPVEQCGTYTRETGFVVNHERVEELNKQLWGE
jgi:SPASM domain peptide maturase of grasp-with-spasm system